MEFAVDADLAAQIAAAEGETLESLAYRRAPDGHVVILVAGPDGLPAREGSDAVDREIGERTTRARPPFGVSVSHTQ
jgi:hypothetical protein